MNQVNEEDARLIPFKFALQDVWLAIGTGVLDAQGVDSITRDEVIDIVLDAGRVDRLGGLSTEQLTVWNAQAVDSQRALAELVFWQPVYN